MHGAGVRQGLGVGGEEQPEAAGARLHAHHEAQLAPWPDSELRPQMQAPGLALVALGAPILAAELLAQPVDVPGRVGGAPVAQRQQDLPLQHHVQVPADGRGRPRVPVHLQRVVASRLPFPLAGAAKHRAAQGLAEVKAHRSQSGVHVVRGDEVRQPVAVPGARCTLQVSPQRGQEADLPDGGPAAPQVVAQVQRQRHQLPVLLTQGSELALAGRGLPPQRRDGPRGLTAHQELGHQAVELDHVLLDHDVGRTEAQHTVLTGLLVVGVGPQAAPAQHPGEVARGHDTGVHGVQAGWQLTAGTRVPLDHMLSFLVGQLAVRADHRGREAQAFELVTALLNGEEEGDGQAVLARQEAERILAEARRQHRHGLPVRGVERDALSAGLQVQRPVPGDRAGHVGNVHGHLVPGAQISNAEGIIQVAGALGVHGEGQEAAAVLPAVGRPAKLRPVLLQCLADTRRLHRRLPQAVLQVQDAEALLPGGGLGQHLQDDAQRVVETLPPQDNAHPEEAAAAVLGGEPLVPHPLHAALLDAVDGHLQRVLQLGHEDLCHGAVDRGHDARVPLIHAAHEHQLAAPPLEHAHHLALQPPRGASVCAQDLHQHLVPAEGHPTAQAAPDLDGARIHVVQRHGRGAVEGLLHEGAAAVQLGLRAQPSPQCGPRQVGVLPGPVWGRGPGDGVQQPVFPDGHHHIPGFIQELLQDGVVGVELRVGRPEVRLCILGVLGVPILHGRRPCRRLPGGQVPH
ncbi:uncharacterized protein LOC121104636 [Ursus maritimus]|uniref:Uncharacterized protein LOC121104636 n=1 Tax=Ursus maritimus TaxID=29073 RepID=A0A8M1GFU0_URSMA|nr:uncharacterized protein LOC121104636 [Ursus maritimus]